MTKLMDLNHPSLAPALLEHHAHTLRGPMTEWARSKKFPPVLLLTGQAGIGKREIARTLAQWLLCQAPTASPSACQQCSSCLKLLAGNHVNLIEIIADEEMGSLKIDQFRDLKASLGQSAYESEFKIILIPYADKMTAQAANSVLKLLEETPPSWKFILTTHDSTLLLPTLLSRCQTLRLKPVPTAKIEALLLAEGRDPRKSKVCAELAQGSWEKATLLAQDDVWANRQAVLQFLKEPYPVVNSLIDWALQKASHLDVLVDALEHLTADLLAWSSTLPTPEPKTYSWRNFDAQAELTLHASQKIRNLGSLESARSFWFNRAERLAQTRRDVLLPLNRKILVQNLLFSWLSGTQESGTTR